MRRAVILALATVALGYLYLAAIAVAVSFAAARPIPPWWIRAFSSSGASVLSWSSGCHSLAVVVASLPFAWIIFRLYGKFSLYFATTIGVATWLILEMPFAMDAFHHPRLWSVWFTDTLVFVVALPALVWGFRRLPSNNAWSGR